MPLKHLLLLSSLAVLGFTATARANETWLTDLNAAKVQATQENKKLLLDFTGSDWCYYCKKLDAEVFATPEFQAYAKNYILVRLDYPRHKEQPATEKAQNAALGKQFNINGYPTVILLDATGQELKREEGYNPGSGPKAYLTDLDSKS